MKKGRFSGEQNAGFIKLVEIGIAINANFPICAISSVAVLVGRQSSVGVTAEAYLDSIPHAPAVFKHVC